MPRWEASVSCNPGKNSKFFYSLDWKWVIGLLASESIASFPPNKNRVLLSAAVLTVLLKQNPGAKQVYSPSDPHPRLRSPMLLLLPRTIVSPFPSISLHLCPKIPLNVPNPSGWHWELADRGPGSRIIITSMMLPATHYERTHLLSLPRSASLSFLVLSFAFHTRGFRNYLSNRVGGALTGQARNRYQDPSWTDVY